MPNSNDLILVVYAVGIIGSIYMLRLGPPNVWYKKHTDTPGKAHPIEVALMLCSVLGMLIQAVSILLALLTLPPMPTHEDLPSS